MRIIPKSTKAAVLALGAVAISSSLVLVRPAGAEATTPSIDVRSLRGTLAYVCEQPDGDDELCLMDIDGARRERITENVGPDRAPTWSADGRQLVFNSRRAPHADRPQIYVFDLAARTTVRVSDGPVEDQRASFTPDGRSVVFQRGTFGTGYELYRQRIGEATVTKLTDNPGKLNVAGSYSPSGTRLVLQSNRDVAGLFPFGTYVVDLVASTTTRLAADVTASHDGPRWSPDGRSIAFAAGGELYVIDLAEGTTERLTTTADSESSPAWSPDGRHLVFQNVPDHDDEVEDEPPTQIELIELATGARRTIGEGRTPVWGRQVRTPDYGRLPVTAERTDAEGLVHRVFLVALERPVDPQGLAFWTGRIERGLSPAQLGRSLVASAEHQRRFGEVDSTAFVTRIYEWSLRRPADPAGLAFWVGRLDRGSAARGDLVISIARSNELVRRIAQARAVAS